MNRGLIEGIEMAIDCGYQVSKKDYEEYLRTLEENKMKKETTTIATVEITFINDNEKKLNKKQLATNIKHMTGADDVNVTKVQEFIMEREDERENRIKELERKMDAATDVLDTILDLLKTIFMIFKAAEEDNK
ncbi:MAG: hypothetical protein ACI4EV_06965 [Lachnospiraceae bacterium]